MYLTELFKQMALERLAYKNKIAELKCLCDSPETWALIQADIKEGYSLSDIKHKALMGSYSGPLKKCPPDRVCMINSLLRKMQYLC